MHETISWPRAILHLDMDAFFVNVHCLEHPEDRGLPLAVGGRPEERGVVASASYEARQFGVRSAMPMSRAVRLCPRLKIVSHNWPRIRQCSRQVMALLADYGLVEQLSVDEAFVDLSQHPHPAGLAPQIRERVKSETGLPASVGLGTSKLIAKVASDFEKPEGCTVVPPGREAAFLSPLSVRVIWGIGPRTAERLATLQIQTCGQLAAADLGQLYALFGSQAVGMQQRAAGIDDRPVQPESGPSQSISQEWTFTHDTNDPGFLDTKLRQMCARVAQAMQEQNLVARTVYIKLRWPDFTTFTRQKTVIVPLDQEEEIYRLAHALWQEHWPAGQLVRLFGVGVSNLGEPAGRQLGFNF